jgi:hypothetical protein
MYFILSFILSLFFLLLSFSCLFAFSLSCPLHAFIPICHVYILTVRCLYLFDRFRRGLYCGLFKYYRMTVTICATFFVSNWNYVEMCFQRAILFVSPTKQPFLYWILLNYFCDCGALCFLAGGYRNVDVA